MGTGYIGLGSMGGAIAARLMQKLPLSVFDIRASAMSDLTRGGACASSGVQELAASCDTIFLCLPTSRHVETVVFGGDGIAGSAKTGTIVIDQTTGDPAETRRIAAKLAGFGIDFVDCPVSGGPRAAQEGSLALIVGASLEQFERVEAILKVISPKIFHVGDVGTGHVVKIVNNMLHHTHRLISMEVVALAARNGVDPSTAIDVFKAGSGSNYFLHHYFRSRVLDADFQPKFTLELLNKDLRLATDMGAQSDVPMLLSNLVRQIYQAATNDLGSQAQADELSVFIDRMAKTTVVGSALR